DDKGFDPKEIPSESEVKTAEVLNVPLPAENVSLHSLALDLGKTLPRDSELPRDRNTAQSWRDARRASLPGVVKAKRFDIEAERTGEEEKDGLKATFWRLKAGGIWSVPVVELSKGEPQGTTLLLADAGRKGASAAAKELLDKGRRVLAVDPFYLGEAKMA